MASKIEAINAYRPKIESGNTVHKQELVRALARATGLNEGSMELTVKELRDVTIEFLRSGRGVKIEGLGSFLPNIDLEGNFDIQFRLDPVLKTGLNVPGTFSGTIINRENIGKSSDDLVGMWNKEHADDPIA